ncbi:MAG: bifunctional diaminohydroxyphosphoribosylaminopyrimidine deaminase/5-amino-6-(5-phosphoribosylamino)uracil reductase RibD [Sutterellaceae bacterium]|nr:bifunctional diaminohydroxyphosphoribosylaminopyrimidine deaminase/5-amino-6-(5-phosphoribosylamino)uracil reductase RibD [Sutterellaceae bacterium]MDD7442189.1 bifunctional diaminohydroxyphosphoribosylaminopyrimidine deaminase/5-amino-6-(5-phosphoribosylamino)uracil reductase RibD [Sutterellaceae bacterium]MDY2868184.1 bifunctional diaminohydroxyphosphoribosylaminopyrimidine deaminase/5-amino-6-(5-phosphoribosylamino)uracil reductase RibD [Mesosutterella sp.]
MESLDEKYMRIALELSAKGRPLSPPNPAVGCVMVKDGRVIAEGFTQKAGGHHAEIEALLDAERRGQSVEGATAYVTLEPCSHYGRTPPCAKALIEHRLGRVVAAMKDPNPRVAGRGLAMLEAAGIPTACGVLAPEAWESNRGFFTRMTRGTPWVTLKVGASIDGKTALPNGESQWITSEAARADVHRLRSEAGAVMTGVGTVLSDDCRLNARLPGRDPATVRQPLRIVVDSSLRTPPGARVIGEEGCLIACAKADPARRSELELRGAEVVEFPGTDGRVDLRALVGELGRREVNDLLLEAGSELNGSMLALGLVDEIIVYASPMLIGSGRGMWNLGPYEKLAQAERWSYHSVSRIGDDLCIDLRKN